MITQEETQRRIRETLVGFPPQVIAAYQAFSEKGEGRDLDAVVLGILHFYLAKKPPQPLEELPGSTRLIEDLGGDSLTMMDTVFMMETLFGIRIDDHELVQLATLDDLRRYLRRLVQGTPPPIG